jgi:hypothetical protein
MKLLGSFYQYIFRKSKIEEIGNLTQNNVIDTDTRNIMKEEIKKELILIENLDSIGAVISSFKQIFKSELEDSNTDINES